MCGDKKNIDMPKVKEDLKHFFGRMLEEFPGQFRTDGDILFCLVCDIEVPAKQKSQVSQHLGTSKHVSGLNRKIKSQKQPKNQMLLTTMKNTDEDRSVNAFAMDLTKCFIASNIPLYTLRKSPMVEFLEKHTKYRVPSESTLRSKCIPKLYEECVQNLKEKAANKLIWVSLDESTDPEERYVVNFIFGILGVESERKRSYLFSTKVLQTVNHTTMAQFFDECVHEMGK